MFISVKNKNEVFVIEEVNTYIRIYVVVIMVVVVVVVVLGSGRVRFIWPAIESTIGCCEQGNASSVSAEGGEFL
jgi:hypothetical protein